jgi:hypothetical protein
MSNTTDELDLYTSALIKKFQRFKPLSAESEQTQKDVLSQIELAVLEGEDLLERSKGEKATLNLPEAFRKEYEDRVKRCKRWLEIGIHELWWYQDTVQMTVRDLKDKTKTIQVPEKITYTISFEEA